MMEVVYALICIGGVLLYLPGDQVTKSSGLIGDDYDARLNILSDDVSF